MTEVYAVIVFVFLVIIFYFLFSFSKEQQFEAIKEADSNAMLESQLVTLLKMPVTVELGDGKTLETSLSHAIALFGVNDVGLTGQIEKNYGKYFEASYSAACGERISLLSKEGSKDIEFGDVAGPAYVRKVSAVIPSFRGSVLVELSKERSEYCNKVKTDTKK